MDTIIDDIIRAIHNTFSDGDMVVACGDLTYMEVIQEGRALVARYSPAVGDPIKVHGYEVHSIPIQCHGFMIMERDAYKRLMLALGRETLREGSLEQFQEMFKRIQL